LAEYLPVNEGLSTTLSTRAIITGQSIEYQKHSCLEYCDCIQTPNIHKNSLTGNAQGSYRFTHISIDVLYDD
jgi:hypothetical protein